MTTRENLKMIAALFVIALGAAAWLWMSYNPDIYAPPKRTQRIEVVP
jgi:hypothetical protein